MLAAPRPWSRASEPMAKTWMRGEGNPVLSIEVSSTSLRTGISPSLQIALSPPRQRMIEDMSACQLGHISQRRHIHSCKKFAAFLGCSPKRRYGRRCPPVPVAPDRALAEHRRRHCPFWPHERDLVFWHAVSPH